MGPATRNTRQPFTLSDGSFWDAFGLMGLLGQTSVAMAMESAEITQYTATVQEGGLVAIRWREADIASLSPAGFAPECLKTIVSSATLDSLYKAVIPAEQRKIFQAVDNKRKEYARAPLPKNVNNLTRSVFEQFKLAHISWTDLWNPSPHQRVINASHTGSRELTYMRQLDECKKSLRTMTAAMHD